MVSRMRSHSDDRTQLLRLLGNLPKDTLPGVEVMGAGYDPFSGYASPLYIVSDKIFNWAAATVNTFKYQPTKTTYSKPEALTAIEISTSTSNIVTGNSIQSYQQNLATSAQVEGSYNFFSGSLSTEFSVQSLTNSSNSFSRMQQSISTWILKLPVGNKGTRELLHEEFRKEIDSLQDDTYKSFFQKYGSHILTGAVIGGCAVRTSSTNKYSVDRSESLEVAAKESFRYASGEADATEKAKYDNTVSSFNMNSNTNQTVNGGNPSLGDQVFKDGGKLSAWRESVIEAPIFVDFTEQDALTPIWELCASDTAGQKIKLGLQSFYESTWAPAMSDEVSFHPDYIDAIEIISGDNSTIPAAEGYTKVDYDLNASAGGKFIYLCYHKQPYEAQKTDAKAIVDVKVIYDNDPVPDQYTKINKDLNEGAKGKFVYLCYKTAFYDIDNVILDFRVFGGKDSDVAVPYGFTKVDKDLNLGAGGHFIYLAYAKRFQD